MPARVDLATGDISCRADPIHIFRCAGGFGCFRGMVLVAAVLRSRGVSSLVPSQTCAYVPARCWRLREGPAAPPRAASPLPARNCARLSTLLHPPAHPRSITFDKENVRDLSTPTSVTTKQGEDVAVSGEGSTQQRLQRGWGIPPRGRHQAALQAVHAALCEMRLGHKRWWAARPPCDRLV